MPRDNDRESLRAGRLRRRDDWDEDDRPRRRRRSRSRVGLWVGLGIGGAALVALVVVLIVVPSSGSSKFGPGGAEKKLVGKWERVGGNPTASMHFLEFTDKGVFR